MPAHHAFIINRESASGRATARWRAIEPELHRRGLSGEVLTPTSREETVTCAARAAEAGRLVVAVGGDGTVRDVLTGLSRASPAPRLAILPLGSGNDAARMVGITSRQAAIEALAGGRSRTIDALEITGGHPTGGPPRQGLVIAGAAFAAEILRHTPASAKRWLGGPLAYALGFFHALGRFRVPEMHIDTGDTSLSGPVLALACANGSTAGGGAMRVAPPARIDDGLLDLIVVRGLGRLQLALQFVNLVRGTHLGHPAVRHQLVREFTFRPTTAVGVALQLDGDLIGQAPARVRVLPGHVEIIVPTP